MRVLVVHNAYQHKGGEDTVMEAEVALLRSKGHEVALFSKHNDVLAGMSKAKAAINTLWSKTVAAEFEETVRAFAPDVVHVHNTFPLISPAIYWVAARLQVPLLQTLHNFRLLCPQAMFLREGKVCEDCLGKLPWRGAGRGCYRDSKLQSTVLAGMVTLHRAIGTWQNKVTRYIALNEFCRGKFIEGGLPAARIVVKPNFVDFEAPAPGERQGFLFVGRLSSEKGIDVLVDAHTKVEGSTLRVAGSGPVAEQLGDVPALCALGALKREEVHVETSRALAVVVPSIWYETFGMVAIEAFASGTPVIASNIGVLPKLVKDGETGLLFEPGNAEDLADKMRWALANPQAMAAMGRNARKQYEAEFTAERNYQQLMAIYESAIAEVREGAAV
jgi:glycosyltransferase involved in cell wall biosynthesis